MCTYRVGSLRPREILLTRAVEIHPSLRGVLSELIDSVSRDSAHGVHGLFPSISPSHLHVSLTHPLPLRVSQIALFKSALSTCLATTPRFRLSLAGLKPYTNGQGRAFLALRIGAGVKELKRLLDAVEGVLRTENLPGYHQDAEFHASFAWALNDTASSDTTDAAQSCKEASGDVNDSAEAEVLVAPSDETHLGPFSDTLLRRLEQEYGRRILDAQPRGGWQADHVEVKVGKTIASIPLR